MGQLLMEIVTLAMTPTVKTENTHILPINAVNEKLDLMPISMNLLTFSVCQMHALSKTQIYACIKMYVILPLLVIKILKENAIIAQRIAPLVC